MLIVTYNSSIRMPSTRSLSYTTVAAVTFFVFEDIMNILLTMDIARKISRLSLGVKVISTTVALISTTIRRILLFTI